ncbi:MAG: LysM peptidoglycan-binding domain-containing protein [Kiritimatiellae bacterium]|jgi:LysM repeat protein|nr:LysM peptidoglycan-binding domain-containing protein [Kiritimatiellia bacterium]
MMNKKTLRMLMGMNLLAGSLFFQGCGLMNKKSDMDGPTDVPELETVEVETIDAPIAPVLVAPRPAPVAVPAKPLTTPYSVMKGDTISGVAYRYYLRWQDVLAVNPGINPKRLRIGQVIQLPGQVNLSKSRSASQKSVKKSSSTRSTAANISAPKLSKPTYKGPTITYIVKKGDSLSVIAYKHGIKTSALRSANSLKSDRIIVGQKLKVPGATKKPAATVKTKSVKKPTPPPVAKSVKTPGVESDVVKVPVAAAAPAEAKTPAVKEAPATAEDANLQTYTVKDGEDVYAVAIRWGVSPNEIKTLNNLKSIELKPGTVIKIPSVK